MVTLSKEKINESGTTNQEHHQDKQYTSPTHSLQQQTNKQEQMTDDLYTEILKSEPNKMTLNDMQLLQLKEAYANMIVDDMDMKTLCQFAFDSILSNLESYDVDDLKDEIVELYDEEVLNNLLEEVDTNA